MVVLQHYAPFVMSMLRKSDTQNSYSQYGLGLHNIIIFFLFYFPKKQVILPAGKHTNISYEYVKRTYEESVCWAEIASLLAKDRFHTQQYT